MPSLLRMLKKAAKSHLRRMGYFVSTIDELPTGVDESTDIRRIGFNIRTVFDVGANVGVKTLTYARRFPGAHIYAFEPIPSTYCELVKNVQGYTNVTCIQSALGSQAGRQSVYLQDHSKLNSLRPGLNVAKQPGVHSEEIEVTTVDTFCRDASISHIDLLKTDTEGFELEVLQGSGDLLRNKGIRFVFAETTFRHQGGRHTKFEDLHSFLEPFGFQFCGLYDAKQRSDGLRYCNALFVRPD